MRALPKGKPIVVSLLLLLASPHLIGCDIGGAVDQATDAAKDITDKVRQILKDLSNQLGAQSDNWQGTIKDAIDKLGKISGTLPQQIGTQLQQVLDRGAAALGTNLGCTSEQLGLELRRFVAELAKQLDTDGPPKPELMIDPVLCVSSPNTVQLPITQLSIHLGGFNLDRGKRAAFYKPTGGKEQDISQHLFLTSPHEMLLQLGQSGFALPEGDGVLILRLNDKDAATLPVLKEPPPPPLPECKVTPLAVVPNDTSVSVYQLVQGDWDVGEESTHTLKTSVQLVFTGQQLYALSSVDILEEGKGLNSILTGRKKELVYSAPYGKRIVDIGLPGSNAIAAQTQIFPGNTDTASRGASGFLSGMDIYIHQPVTDYGYTGFRAHFANLNVTLEEDDKVVACRRKFPRNGLLIVETLGRSSASVEAPLGVGLFPYDRSRNIGFLGVPVVGKQTVLAKSSYGVLTSNNWKICPGIVSSEAGGSIACTVNIAEDQVVETQIQPFVLVIPHHI